MLLRLLDWTGLARLVRGKVLALRREDYAVAARLLGASHARVSYVHLPGVASYIIVAPTLSVRPGCPARRRVMPLALCGSPVAPM